MSRNMCCAALIIALAGGPQAALAQASPPAPEASPPSAAMPEPMASGGGDATTVDPAIVSRAKDWLRRLQTATLDRSQLDDQMNAALTEAAAKQSAAQIGPLGPPTAFVFLAKKGFPGNTAYKFRVTFKTSTLFWLFVTDDAGKISGLRFMPEHQ
jgi:hypothetical protein